MRPDESIDAKTKVALIIIYNHQYNKNIDILELIYKDRFHHIYHLVPFYDGDKINVIPIYESSYYFQGYISQGLSTYFKESYEHYFFIADDLVLNPIINQTNYSDHLKLNSNANFISGFIPLHDTANWWPRVGDAFRWNINDAPGVEASNQLPNYASALQKFRNLDLTIEPVRFDQIWKAPSSLLDWLKLIISRPAYRSFHDPRNGFMFVLRYLTSKLTKRTYPLSYPMVGAYSDIVVVSGKSIRQFCHYCGVFAATQLFVEVALPTALVLSAYEIVTEKNLELRGKALWGTDEEHKELDRYESSLGRLLSEFPNDYLYLHPIKLSKWQTE